MSERSVNRVELLGRVGKDAETKFTGAGAAVTNFSVATTRSWKDQASGEWKEATDWHNIVLWKQENLSNYLLKGTRVYVAGRLQTRNYEKEGRTIHITEIVADEVILLGVKDGESSAGKPSGLVSKPRATSAKPNSEITDDDVPF